MIDGGEGNDKISVSSDSENMTLIGGAGADTIYTNGNGNLIQAGDGKDVIFGFEGNDSIQIDGEFKSMRQSGANVLVTVDSTVITIRSANTSDLEVEDNTIYINSTEGLIVEGTILTADNSFTGSKIDLTTEAFSEVERVNATVVAQDIKIIGNALDNSILGGKGNDTLYGGEGDDTYDGKGGSDTFVYSAGDDTIKNYATMDRIKIEEAELYDIYTQSSNVIIETSNGFINVQGGRDKNITIIDANDDEQVYNSSNGNLAVPEDDLFADDNFIGGTTIDDVSEITATNYSVGKVETGTVELAQDTLSAALAYGQDK